MSHHREMREASSCGLRADPDAGGMYQEAMEPVAECLGGMKRDAGKPPLSLVSQELMVGLAKVREFGANKYERWNWTKGFAYSRSIDAALRHIHAFNAGEDYDSESKLTHIVHAIASLEHLLHDFCYRPENDDRFKGSKE